MGRLVVFISIATSLLLAAHAYVGSRIIAPARLPAPWGLVAWSVVGLFVVVHPVAMILRMTLRPSFGDRLQWVSYVALGIFSMLFFLSVLRDLGWLVAMGARVLPTDPSRREALLNSVNLALLATTGVLTGIGYREATGRVRVVDVRVPIANLPPALEGFKIAQITDVHIGPTIKRPFLEGVVDSVNAIEADVIAITGDLVDGSVEALAQHVEPLQRLRARHGTFFVTGNHEYYAGADSWVAHVRTLGLTPLMNEHRVLEHDGAQLVLAGVTDYNGGTILESHTSDPARAAAGAPTSSPRVLLAHQPRTAAAAAQAGFDLQLSGHTHGGQFIPWSLLVPLQQPFTAGLHSLGKLQVYVSRGTGYWGPPLRLGAPSEITRITLTRA